MTRYVVLAFATVCSACVSPATTAMPDSPGAPAAQALSAQPVDLADDNGMKSTLPMATQERKDGPIDTLARTLHVYWFFGSR